MPYVDLFFLSERIGRGPEGSLPAEPLVTAKLGEQKIEFELTLESPFQF